MVTGTDREAKNAMTHGLRRLLQLNHDQPYELDREALIALVDELLAELSKK